MKGRAQFDGRARGGCVVRRLRSRAELVADQEAEQVDCLGVDLTGQLVPIEIQALELAERAVFFRYPVIEIDRENLVASRLGDVEQIPDLSGRFRVLGTPVFLRRREESEPVTGSVSSGNGSRPGASSTEIGSLSSSSNDSSGFHCERRLALRLMTFGQTGGSAESMVISVAQICLQCMPPRKVGQVQRTCGGALARSPFSITTAYGRGREPTTRDSIRPS